VRSKSSETIFEISASSGMSPAPDYDDTIKALYKSVASLKLQSKKARPGAAQITRSG